MRSHTACYFECTCKYDKIQDDQTTKRVSETNVVDAISFAEAEARFCEEMRQYTDKEVEVTAIRIAPYKEVFFSDNESDDRWYRAKVAFIQLDEKTGKEKRQNVNYLVQAASLDRAIKNVNEAMNGSMTEYSSISVSESRVVDVFEYVNDN